MKMPKKQYLEKLKVTSARKQDALMEPVLSHRNDFVSSVEPETTETRKGNATTTALNKLGAIAGGFLAQVAFSNLIFSVFFFLAVGTQNELFFWFALGAVWSVTILATVVLLSKRKLWGWIGIVLAFCVNVGIQGWPPYRPDWWEILMLGIPFPVGNFLIALYS